jgi:prevent-host-death family protein
MTQYVSLRDANQYLSRYIRMIEQGEDIVITRRGRAVAKLTAIDHERQPLTPERQAALERLRQRIERGYSLGGLRSERDEAHER